MNFIKTKNVVVCTFDIDKIKAGAMVMIHFNNGDRYGMVTDVAPNCIQVHCEDTSTPIIEAKNVRASKGMIESDDDVALEFITPEEMYQIFNNRIAPVKYKSGYAHNVGMKPVSEKNLALARNIMCNLADGGNKKATFFLINSSKGKLSARMIYEHICKEAFYTISIRSDEDLENAIRKTILNWLETNIQVTEEISPDDDATSMYKVIEECASEGNIIAKAFLRTYEEQTEDKCKTNDEDLGKKWRAAGDSHDKAKIFWSLASIWYGYECCESDDHENG